MDKHATHGEICDTMRDMEMYQRKDDEEEERSEETFRFFGPSFCHHLRREIEKETCERHDRYG